MLLQVRRALGETMTAYELTIRVDERALAMHLALFDLARVDEPLSVTRGSAIRIPLF